MLGDDFDDIRKIPITYEIFVPELDFQALGDDREGMQWDDIHPVIVGRVPDEIDAGVIEPLSHGVIYP